MVNHLLGLMANHLIMDEANSLRVMVLVVIVYQILTLFIHEYIVDVEFLRRKRKKLIVSPKEVG